MFVVNLMMLVSAGGLPQKGELPLCRVSSNICNQQLPNGQLTAMNVQYLLVMISTH